MHGNFGGKKGGVERNRASDEARAMLEERGRVRGGGCGARGDSQHIGAVVRWRVGKNGSKTPKENRGKHLKPEGASAVRG